MEFNVRSIRLRDGFKVFDSFGVTLSAIATEPEQHAGLHIRRIGIQRAPERIDRRLEVPLLELRQAEVKEYFRQLPLLLERESVGRSGCLRGRKARQEKHDNPQLQLPVLHARNAP